MTQEEIRAHLDKVIAADTGEHMAAETRDAYSSVLRYRQAVVRDFMENCAREFGSGKKGGAVSDSINGFTFVPRREPEPLTESADTEAVFDLDAITAMREPARFRYFHEIARKRALAQYVEAISEEEVTAEAEALRQEIENGWELEKPKYGPALGLEQTEEEEAVGEFANYFEGEARYRELCRNETGSVISLESAKKRWASFELKVRQSERMADCCEMAGHPVRYVAPGEPNPDNRPVRPTVALIPLGEPDRVVYMPNIQRVAVFPVFASALRAEKIRSLRYILDRRPFARMATFTAGTRDRDEARLSNLRRGYKHFRKALGNMMKHRFFRRHVRGLYIGVEYGTPKRVSPDGISRDISFHQHAHYLYEPELRWDGRVWSKDQWSRLRRWCRLKMAAEMRGWRGRDRERGLRDDVDGVHCELGKRIEDVNEVCKYPFKDADIDTLIELGGPAAIRTFVEQTKGLRYSTPVGDLKKLRYEVKMESERFVIVSTPDGKVVDRAKNWNLFRPDPWGQRERRNRRAALRRNLRPEVIEKRRAKLARRFCSRVRRPLWRLCVLEEKLRQARRNIEARECPLHWHGVIEAIELEKRGLFRFLLEAFETAPRALAREGLADQLAAPWLGDLRAYFAKCGFLCEFDAIMREGRLDTCGQDGRETNAKEAEEKRTGRPVVNLLMARCAPFASGYWRVTQPVAAVVGYNGDFEALCEHTPLVRETAERSRTHIAAALAVADRQAAMPALRTRAPGVRAHACLPGPHYPNNSPGTAPPWAPDPDFWPPEWAKIAEKNATSPLQTA